MSGRPSLAAQLVQLVQDAHVVLFHDEEPRAFALLERDGHRETWPIKSKTFKHYLRWLCHAQLGRTPNAQAVADAVATLDAIALFDGEQHPVFLRVAGTDGVTYIDLGDPGWNAIRITDTGWEVVADHPVRFRRSAGMAPLPFPNADGDLEQLRQFVNVRSDDDYRLLAGWLLAALRAPGQPYPVLILHGEQGSAKSTSARIVRALVDPSSVPLRAAPRELRDLMVSANAGWTLSFDNLSRLEPWLSDALCRIATGGGFATRELYTDDDEVIFDAQRPVIINGIEEVATRSDLLDRAVLLSLPPIPSEQRRNEKDVWEAFEQARPMLLGALLDGLVSAVATIDSVHLARLPRMADFALWVSAAEPGLGWEPGSFIASYEGNRSQAHDLAVEATPAGQALVDIAAAGFRGTAGELLTELVRVVADDTQIRQRGWPTSARAVSSLVRRLAPNLRELGNQVEFSREPGTRRRRIIALYPTGTTVPTDPTDPGTTPTPGGQEDPNHEHRPDSQTLPWDDRDGRDGRDGRDDHQEPAR